MWDTKQLREHLYKYKDAIIIIGDKNRVEESENIRNLTRKNLKRNPELFWTSFSEIFKTYKFNNYKELYKCIKNIIDKEIIDIIIDQTLDGQCKNVYKVSEQKLLSLKGNLLEYKCPVCNNNICIDPENDTFKNKCEKCNVTLEPQILYLNEQYNKDMIKKIYDSIEKTHTLILINTNFSEKFILDMILDYSNIRYISSENKIVVCLDDSDIDINKEICKCEFLVRDNPNDSIQRFFKIIE